MKTRRAYPTTETLERIIEPEHKLTEVLTGNFNFTKDGIQRTAPFYVRCEPMPELDNPEFEEIKDRRKDAQNSQTVSAWSFLESQECSDIEYKNVLPDPFI